MNRFFFLLLIWCFIKKSAIIDLKISAMELQKYYQLLYLQQENLFA